jgi:hypothetical protein
LDENWASATVGGVIGWLAQPARASARAAKAAPRVAPRLAVGAWRVFMATDLRGEFRE